MFGAINMTREQNFYIINLLPWRPPGNRKPTVAECEVCLPFVKRHIELFKPKLIILIGGTSANSIMNVKTGITKLRGKWSKFKLDDQMIPMITIFHPSYLLRQPQFKKLAWQDLLSIKEHLESQKSD
jgi:DNA polymerase